MKNRDRKGCEMPGISHGGWPTGTKKIAKRWDAKKSLLRALVEEFKISRPSSPKVGSENNPNSPHPRVQFLKSLLGNLSSSDDICIRIPSAHSAVPAGGFAPPPDSFPQPAALCV